MKELKEKAQALIDKYTPELSSKGLKILLSKRYFESEVGERIGATGTGAIFNSIEKAHDRKKEKHKYKYERNKYHTFIITVEPNEKSVLSHKCCRDYAFVLKKVERAHIGEEPRHVAYEEEKTLSKIEKLILKTLKKAERLSVQKICKDTFCDVIRYTMKAKYGYKKHFYGKERFTWDLLIGGGGAAILALIIISACLIISK